MDEENGMPKPNSHKYKREAAIAKKPAPEKVIHGKAVQRREPFGKKLKDAFVSEDAPSAGEYVLEQVIIPTVKEAASETVKTLVDVILYGERRGGSSKRSSAYVSYDSYDRYRYDRTYMSHPNVYSHERRGLYDFKDYILPTREDAQVVLEELTDYADEYGFVSVADLYSLLGEEPVHTDHKYGWTALGSATIKRERDGWSLVLPRPRPLD